MIFEKKEFMNCMVFCERNICGYTFWKIMKPSEIEYLRCPLCGYECKIVFSRDLR